MADGQISTSAELHVTDDGDIDRINVNGVDHYFALGLSKVAAEQLEAARNATTAAQNATTAANSARAQAVTAAERASNAAVSATDAAQTANSAASAITEIAAGNHLLRFGTRKDGKTGPVLTIFEED